jgi:uncharacterized membrane protein YhaH (DUF805 family)
MPDYIYSVYEQPPYLPMPKVFKFSFEGRYGRLNYIKAQMLMLFVEWAFLPVIGLLIYIDNAVSVGSENDAVFGLIAIALAILVFVPLAIFQIRSAVLRFHDLNKSGVWLLTVFIPLVSLVVSVCLFALPGTKGINNYGQPSLRSSYAYLIIWLALCAFVLVVLALGFIFGAAESPNAPRWLNSSAA